MSSGATSSAGRAKKDWGMGWEGVIQYYLDKGKTQEQAEALAEDQDE